MARTMNEQQFIGNTRGINFTRKIEEYEHQYQVAVQKQEAAFKK